MALSYFIILISLLKYGVSDPGYSSLSDAIMNSMTDLWNEKQTNTFEDKREVNSGWWDYLNGSDSGDENKSINEQSELAPVNDSHPTAPIAYTMVQNNTDEKKADYLQYSQTKKHNNKRRNWFKSGKNPLKSEPNDYGPLYRALFHANPLSFDDLLHYYDYLDSSSSEESSSCKTKSKDTESIQSMLNKFLKTLTDAAGRPVVVHTNVCCNTPNTSIPEENNSAGIVASKNKPKEIFNNKSENASTIPAYIQNMKTPTRYAEKQEDIVKKLKDQYDKMVKLVNSIGYSNASTSFQLEISSRSPEAESSPPAAEESVTTEKINDPLASETTTIAPFLSTSVIADDPFENFLSTEGDITQITTEQAKNEESITSDEPFETTSAKLPKDEVENISPEQVDMADNNPITEPSQERTEATVLETTDPAINSLPEENALSKPAEPAENVEPVENEAVTLKRRKRASIKYKKKNQPPAPKDEVGGEQSSQDADYDEFAKDSVTNKTVIRDTLVLNRSPIVEHIHDYLLQREKKIHGEWQSPVKSSCGGSRIKEKQSEPVDTEKLIADPPDFVVNIGRRY